MLVAENRQYDYLLEDPIYKPKRRVKTQPKVKKSKKIKYVTFTIIGLSIALTILFQYAKLNIINQEIISLENDMQRLYMLNDSVEGEILASEDLKRIEKIAREELGMVEPTIDQMATIEIQNSHNMELATANTNTTPSSGLLESLSKVLEFID